MILYRPVGMNELKLIYEASMKAFPPRLPEQPIFYPVLNLQYAEQIAREWNTKQAPYAGYVTRFEIDDNYGASFERRVVGSKIHEEIWVPAEELPAFNRRIISTIVVVKAFFGSGFSGYIPEKGGLAGSDADEQLRLLSGTVAYSKMDFYLEIAANHLMAFLNYPYWECCDVTRIDLSEERRRMVLKEVRNAWSLSKRTFELTGESMFMG